MSVLEHVAYGNVGIHLEISDLGQSCRLFREYTQRTAYCQYW